MSKHDRLTRRETFARRAFFAWMAVYAAVVVAIAVTHVVSAMRVGETPERQIARDHSAATFGPFQPQAVSFEDRG